MILCYVMGFFLDYWFGCFLVYAMCCSNPILDLKVVVERTKRSWIWHLS